MTPQQWARRCHYQGGVLHWLGCCGKPGQRGWRNPHSIGAVRVSASSVTSGSLSDLVADDVGCFSTADEPNSWIGVHLGGAVVTATHFTLGYFKGGRCNFPVRWVLEASNDGEEWTVIHTQVHTDRAFSTGREVATWPVEVSMHSVFTYYGSLLDGRVAGKVMVYGE